MRIPCPICGMRDRREFYYRSEDVLEKRPATGADLAQWDDYLHKRDNLAGITRDLWQHQAGCGAWLIVARNNSTHEITSVSLAKDELGK